MKRYLPLLLIALGMINLSIAMEQPVQPEKKGTKRDQPEGVQEQQPAKIVPKWVDQRHLHVKANPKLRLPAMRTGYDFTLFTGTRYNFGMNADGSLFFIQAMPQPMKIVRLHRGSNAIDGKGLLLVGVNENNVVRLHDMTNPAAPYTLNLGVTPFPVKD